MNGDEALQPLAREHQHFLMLCSKIRVGLIKKIAPERIKVYTDWYFDQFIVPHFRIEEKCVFPVLGENHESVKKALAAHRRLKRLFNMKSEIEKSLSRIEEELERHVRYEERTLFPKVIGVASSDELELIRILLSDNDFVENTEDEFWL